MCIRDSYYADLPAMWQDVPNNEVLEELFQVFNLSRPQDFEAVSYTHLDVYKRQVMVDADSLPPA